MARKAPSKKAASKGGKKGGKKSSSGGALKFGSPEWRAKYAKKGRKKSK